MSEIFYRYNVKIDEKKFKLKLNGDDYFSTVIPFKKPVSCPIIIHMDDFNLTIDRINNNTYEDLAIKLTLDYRKIMLRIFGKDFLYKDDLKTYISNNKEFENKNLRYIEREILKTKYVIDKYNLEEDMPNTEYLKILQEEEKFYKDALLADKSKE